MINEMIFYFDIVNFPFLDVDTPRSASYGVYIYQLIRCAQMSSHVDDFNTCYKVFIAKLLRQGYRYQKHRRAFSKFYRRHFDIVSKYNVGLKNVFCKAFQSLNFMGTWYINSEKTNGKNDFLYHFKKIIVRYTWLSLVMSLMMSFCADLFPYRCLR